MIPKIILQHILIETAKLDEKTITADQKKATLVNQSLEEYIVNQNILTEEQLYHAAADALHIPFAPLSGEKINKEVLHLIPEPLAETHKMVALTKDGNSLKIAALDPTDIQTIEFIKRKTKLDVDISMTTPTAMRTALRQYHDDLQKEIKIPFLTQEQKNNPKVLKRAAEELPVINIVTSILEHAVYENASDIHIEPTDTSIVVRYRIDGILHQVMKLPKSIEHGMAARIKILAHLKIDEHMMPQDGRFKIALTDDEYAFRVSLIPVYNGEKIVMRLLHEGTKPLTLDELGLLPQAKVLLQTAISKPHGMVLVTGPTGSGKTTTLYSLLGILNTADVNICTIEDPIEYHVSGINQSQINLKAGFTFAIGLRAFLRQDPDIIMVGEIRDQETAEIAIHSAMTGHLVLSTLHTNDAATTLPRLIDMGIPTFLIAFTTNIIVAQRLIRKICKNCKQEYTLNKKEISELQKLSNKQNVITLFAKQKIILSSKEKKLDSMTFYRGQGCSRCTHSGYKGRIGIYEILDIDEQIKKLINQRANAEQIKTSAIENGMLTMFQDGLIKAKQGISTIEEVLRATRD